MTSTPYPICFVTQTVLPPGTRVKLLPLRAYGGRHRRVVSRGSQTHTLFAGGDADDRALAGPKAFWQPVGSFLDAKTIERGSFVLSETALSMVNVQLLLQAVRRDACTLPTGYRQEHVDFQALLRDYEIALQHTPTLETLFPAGAKAPVYDGQHRDLRTCWGYLWHAYKAGEVFLPPGEDVPPAPLQFAVMHEAAFAKLVEQDLQTCAGGQPLLQYATGLFDAAYQEVRATRIERDKFNMALWPWLARHSRQLMRFSAGLQDRIAEAYLACRAHGVDPQQAVARALPWLECVHAYSALAQLNLSLPPIAYAQTLPPQPDRRFEQLVRAVNDGLAQAG